MSDKIDTRVLAGTESKSGRPSWRFATSRRALSKVALLLGLGMWIGGGPDRYGEADGLVGGFRGAARTMSKSCRYLAATMLDMVFQQRSSVRNLGLAQQVETRLWQDKRLVAEAIVVVVEEEGTAVLKGIVPDREHKERAVALAQDTRGVSRVVDQLAVSPTSRVIDTAPSAPVPTGVASGIHIQR